MRVVAGTLFFTLAVFLNLIELSLSQSFWDLFPESLGDLLPPMVTLKYRDTDRSWNLRRLVDNEVTEFYPDSTLMIRAHVIVGWQFKDYIKPLSDLSGKTNHVFDTKHKRFVVLDKKELKALGVECRYSNLRLFDQTAALRRPTAPLNLGNPTLSVRDRTLLKVTNREYYQAGQEAHNQASHRQANPQVKIEESISPTPQRTPSRPVQEARSLSPARLLRTPKQEPVSTSPPRSLRTPKQEPISPSPPTSPIRRVQEQISPSPSRSSGSHQGAPPSSANPSSARPSREPQQGAPPSSANPFSARPSREPLQGRPLTTKKITLQENDIVYRNPNFIGRYYATGFTTGAFYHVNLAGRAVMENGHVAEIYESELLSGDILIRNSYTYGFYHKKAFFELPPEVRRKFTL